MSKRRISISARAALALTFSLGAVVTLFVRLPPVSGYEPTLFYKIQPLVWVVLLPIVGLYILAFRNAWSSSRPFETGGLIVGIVYLNLLVLSLPAIRGYLFYGRSDPATILSRIQYINATGSIGPRNVYPATHMLSIFLSAIADVTLEAVMFLVPIVFVSVSVPFVYTYATSIFDRYKYVAIACLGSTVLLLSYRQAYVLFDQQLMALLYVVLVLYLFHEVIYSNKRYYVMLVVVLAALTLFHPVAILLFLITTASILAVDLLGLVEDVRVDSIALPVGAVAAIITIQWFIYVGFLRQVLLRVSTFLFSSISHRALERNVGAIGSFDPYAFISLFLRTMMHDLLFSVISGIVVLYVVFRTLIDDDFQPGFSVAILSIWFLVASAVQVGHVLTGIFNLFIYRFVGPVVIVTPLLLAVGARAFDRRANEAGPTIVSFSTLFVLLMAVFLISAPIGLLSAHPSPYTHGANQQVTESELASAVWTINRAPDDARARGIITRPFRFADMLRGTAWRRDSDVFFRRGYRIAPQFGYNGTAGERTTVRSESYVFISGADRYAVNHSSGLWSNYDRSNYSRFLSDPGVSKPYSSGVTDIYVVNNSSA